MDDLIRREDAINAFDPKHNCDWYTPWIVATLKSLPSIEPKKGIWNVCDRKDIPYGLMCECSNCGWEEHTNIMLGYNFCPNCGADMR